MLHWHQRRRQHCICEASQDADSCSCYVQNRVKPIELHDCERMSRTVGYECRNTCYPMFGFGHSRVKSSVYFGWFSVEVPVVRLQL